MKLKNILLVVSMAMVSTSALANISTAPVQTPKYEEATHQTGDTEYVSEYDADRIRQAFDAGYTVVRCFEGKCWDFITKDPYGYEGGEVENGFYFFLLEPNDPEVDSE